MHELSIAYSLVKTVEDAAKKANAHQVTVVNLKLGALSGVVKDALLFSYDIATEGTLLAGSKLVIEEVPVVIYCDVCEAEQALPNPQSFRCPVCDTITPVIVQGKELEITTLEIVDETPNS